MKLLTLVEALGEYFNSEDGALRSKSTWPAPRRGAMLTASSHGLPRRGAGLNRPQSAVATAEYVASRRPWQRVHNAEMPGNLLCDFVLARTEDGEGIGSCAKALTALEERGKWDIERVQKVMQTCVHAPLHLSPY